MLLSYCGWLSQRNACMKRWAEFSDFDIGLYVRNQLFFSSDIGGNITLRVHLINILLRVAGPVFVMPHETDLF